MSKRPCLAAWALAPLVAGLGACHCGASPAPEPDARPPDAQPLPDAGVDADQPDAWVDASPCDATLIELPPTGISYISVVSNWGRWVAYDYDENGGGLSRPDIYLYDLKTCTERRITHDSTLTDWQPSLWSNQLVYSEELDQQGHFALSRYDLASNTSTQLLPATLISNLGAMGDFVVYAASPPGQPSQPQDIYMVDVSTGESSLLETSEDGAGSGGDMSETHYAWPSGVMNEYRGIWVVELATREKSRVGERGTFPTTWGDWVVWEDWRSGGPDLWGVRMGAGEQVHVTDNGAFNGYPRLRGHLLCFRTTLWAGGLGWDIALLDMDSWVIRRITPTTHPGYSCGHADSGWLVYRQQVRENYVGYDKIFAVNLAANGFLDAQGHVIPE